MNEVMELINRRRRQLHVHSVIYYHLNTNIISDAQFDEWSEELYQLHRRHPELISQGYAPELFEDWNGNTGMHLPVDDNILKLAYELVRGE